MEKLIFQEKTWNHLIEGKITVYKTGDIFKGLQLKEEHGETVTKAIFEKGYLSDVGFDIVAANDIVDPANGQVLYHLYGKRTRMEKNNHI